MTPNSANSVSRRCNLFFCWASWLSAVHALVPTAGSEDFAEPVAAQLRIRFAIDNHRSSAFVKPGSQALQVRDIADGDSLRAHGRGDGGKVVVSEESPMSRQADVFKAMR